MSKGQFPLGKWESNIDALNDDKDRVETKLLGVGWNKKEDTFAVDLDVKETPTVSKRTMLKMIASFYDPLGLMSPILVEGKHLDWLAADEKRGWDNEVSRELKETWVKWLHGLQNVKIPRSIAPYLEDITTIVLHHLMDASSKAVTAQTIAIVTQPSGITQALVTSKSRITKRGLSIARQDLVVCLMGANIAANTSKALKRWPIIENVCWTDSQVALCWIEKPYSWKSFVSKRVRKIKKVTEEIEIKWKHVPTKFNHADAGSRGASHNQLDKMDWWNGPNWLMDQSRWPDQVNLLNEHNEEIQKESKANKEHGLLTATERNMADVLLEKATLKKAKRVISWCFRFVQNSKSKMLKDPRKVGPLTMEEVERANNYLIIKAQEGVDLKNREA